MRDRKKRDMEIEMIRIGISYEIICNIYETFMRSIKS